MHKLQEWNKLCLLENLSGTQLNIQSVKITHLHWVKLSFAMYKKIRVEVGFIGIWPSWLFKWGQLAIQTHSATKKEASWKTAASVKVGHAVIHAQRHQSKKAIIWQRKRRRVCALPYATTPHPSFPVCLGHFHSVFRLTPSPFVHATQRRHPIRRDSESLARRSFGNELGGGDGRGRKGRLARQWLNWDAAGVVGVASAWLRDTAAASIRDRGEHTTPWTPHRAPPPHRRAH